MSTIRNPEELYGLLTRVAEPTGFASGEVIFEKGDRGDGMYIVSEGTVALKDGDRVLDTVTAPGLFGELALIESGTRALTAVAQTDAQLVGIGARQFWVLVHETPGFAHLVMTVMARRLRGTGATT